MSQLNSLLESANPYKSLQSDAARLANKWDKTGLLEGISDETNKNNMSMILENQAKQLVMEESNTGGGNGAGNFTPGTGAQWAGVALPLVRKVFGQIAAKEFVSVQPMNLPSGLVFYLDFQYGTSKTPFSSAAGENSMYGFEGGNAPFGNTNAGGLYGAGRFGYSINDTQSAATGITTSSADFFRDLNADDSLITSASLAANETYKLVKVSASMFPNGDLTAVKGFYPTEAGTAIAVEDIHPQYTRLSKGTTHDTVHFIVNKSAAEKIHGNGGAATIEYTLQPTDADRGDFEDGNTNLNGDNATIDIPEINVQMRSSAIVAKTRKLKAVWTPEFAQDLNAYHSLDAEAELTSIMSEYISLEIDLEILSMLMDAASGQVEYWSARNNVAIDASGVITDDLAFYNSQGQWFQTLGTKMQKLSNLIHQKTLRGGANFMVISPKVATILESIPGFASNSDGDVAKMKYAFGVQKAGQMNSRYDVYKNPYMKENQILMGYRGGQFLEAGAVFAPYIPLIMTPLVYDPTTFTPRKGLLTRYAKKVVRPEFYGLINVGDLNTL